MESQKSPLPQKYPQVLEKAFHKNTKTCRAGFHKKPTKQDGTHMTIRSQITIPTSIFPTTHTTISPAYIPPIFNHTHYTIHSSYNTFPYSQLHLLYTQNSLNAHHKLLIHIHTYSASSINVTAWSHSTPQTLTSTSKQILHYNKHLYYSCWYLKGEAVASCENCETINSGDYKSAMAQIT